MDHMTFATSLRSWREKRGFSQLALASEAEISQRHLSFLETGRSAPSRDMVLLLAETLDLSLRARNDLLHTAGFAHCYHDRSADDEDVAATYQAVKDLIDAHAPYPALAMDRHWTIVHANAALLGLFRDVPAPMMAPPVNALRLSLHPDGLGKHIANYREWRHHILTRLEAQNKASPDAATSSLIDELKSYPVPSGSRPWTTGAPKAVNRVAIPLTLDIAGRKLSFTSATTVLGTAMDIGLSELTLETFLPANRETADYLHTTI